MRFTAQSACLHVPPSLPQDAYFDGNDRSGAQADAAKGQRIVNQNVPTALLFEYRFRIPVCPDPSRKKNGRLLKLPATAQLPALATLDGRQAFAALSAGWNSNGFGINVGVRGRTRPPTGDSGRLGDSDCVELWIDTRPVGTVHRATGYCHRLACLPSDQSAGGAPSAVSQAIPQQREIRADMQTRHIQLRVHLCTDGYDMEVWIPESQLYGYHQIDDLRQLGFYCVVKDTELGDQPLTITDEFPFAWDPSLWVNLELTDK